KIGDDGTVVFTDAGAVHVIDFNLNAQTKIAGGFDNFGTAPSISDGADPWIAFAAHSVTLGDGIFAAEASNPKLWYKIVGVADDGHLDPNETWVDRNNNGKYDRGEDFGAIQS